MHITGSTVLGLEHLLANEVIEEFLPLANESYGVVICGWIPEKLHTPKARLRHVSDAVAANIESSTPTVSFRPIGALLRSAALLCQQPGVIMVQLDLKTSFFQVSLPPAARNAFVFRSGKNFYRYKRLPMGYKLAVDILQLIMEDLALLVLEGLSPLMVDLYVDNALFVIHESELPFLLAAISKVITLFNITLGELNVGRAVTHRGCTFDFNAQTYCLGSSFQAKILSRLPLPTSTRISRLALETLHGSLQYAEQIIRPSFARDQYHQIGSLRACFSPSLRLSPALRAELFRSRSWLFSCVPLSRWLPNTTQSVAFCDSSGIAMASVIYNPTSTVTYHATHNLQPHHTLNISQLELRTVVQTLLISSPAPPRIYSDNLSAVYCMLNRFSKRIAMMSELRRLSFPFINYEVAYINTRFNPADTPSRCIHASKCPRPPPLLSLLQSPMAFVTRNAMGCRRA